MKLSEQIGQTCCGVLADKQALIDKAKTLEDIIADLEEVIKFVKNQLLELDNEIK